MQKMGRLGHCSKIITKILKILWLSKSLHYNLITKILQGGPSKAY